MELEIVSVVYKEEIPVFNSSFARGRASIFSIATGTAALLLLSVGQQAALAQQGQQRQTTPNVTESVASAPDILKEKVSLPNLPEYTGKAKFLRGLIYNHIKNEKQGPAYVMNFNAKETQAQVHEWWLNSLRQYRWNITYTSPDVVQGTDKDGATCIIQIGFPTPGVAKDDKSSFVVRYQSLK
jgi:hypothetical protein